MVWQYRLGMSHCSSGEGTSHMERVKQGPDGGGTSPTILSLFSQELIQSSEKKSI